MNPTSPNSPLSDGPLGGGPVLGGRTRSARRWAAPVGLAAAGVVAGAVLAGTFSANAVPTPSPSSGAPEATEKHGPSNETPLTGTAADSVKAAVLAKYPGATIDKVESDAAAAYEAHIVTSAGQRLTVLVSKAFVVTGTRHGGGGRHGRSNTDPAHEAAESPAHAAEEKARDAAAPGTQASPGVPG